MSAKNRNDKSLPRMKKISLDEITELMGLRGWSKARLAAELDLTQNAIDRWFLEDRQPSGPAAILMRLWLDASRKKKVAV